MQKKTFLDFWKMGYALDYLRGMNTILFGLFAYVGKARTLVPEEACIHTWTTMNSQLQEFVHT